MKNRDAGLPIPHTMQLMLMDYGKVGVDRR